MECTQRLECTQELYTQSEISTEQVGFLGICGTKYPLKKGPNKVGRDQQTCNIVLNSETISRHHAVINILNQREFMVMDLGSSNKTKLLDKTLMPYMPYPLKNGDTVQFGQVFGIFRLLEDDDDLPMTQAISIPETPLPTPHLSKFNHAPITMIPESPDVSDKDDSFIIPSQPHMDKKLKNSNQHYIKPSSKTISIQPVGSKKIDNIYWNSSKKSKSICMHSNDSIESPNNSIESNQNDYEIHDMETQPPYPKENKNDSFYTAETQRPGESQASSIHNLDTQLPTTEHLPDVRKVHGQNEMRLDLYAANKENHNNIFNAETQIVFNEDKKNVTKDKKPSTSSEGTNLESPKSKTNTSDEEILFDEIDSQPFQNDFESQFILTEEKIIPNKSTVTPSKAQKVDDNIGDEAYLDKPAKRVTRMISGSSTEGDDIHILMTQKIPEHPPDDDTTDCEDDLNDINKSKDLNDPHTKSPVQVNFEDMLTQVIEVDINKKDIVTNNNIVENEPDVEDLPTQVIDEVIPNNIEYNMQQFSEEVVGSFKIPVNSKLKLKRKDIPRQSCKPKPETEPVLENVEDAHFYESTQDVYNDLYSERKLSPEIGTNKIDVSKETSSDRSVKVDENFTIENKLSKKSFNPDKSCSSSEGESKVVTYVSSLSREQVRDVIGVDSVKTLKKTLSDSSDIDSTPKKLRPFNFMNIDLPNSQEIKTSVCPGSKSVYTESSSDSETENYFDEQKTPILFQKKKIPKGDTKIDLSKKFDVETLPSRVITRVRKPTTKGHESETSHKKDFNNILKPHFLAEQEDDINKEIICENISRLKNEKSQINKNFKNNKNSDVIKKDNDIPENYKKERKKINKKSTTNKKNDSVRDSIPVNQANLNLKENIIIKNSMKPNKNHNIPSDETSEINDIRKEIQNMDTSIDLKPPNRSTRSARNKIKIIEALPMPPKPDKEKKESKQNKSEPHNNKRTDVRKEKADATVEYKRSSRSSYKAKNLNKKQKNSPSPEHERLDEQTKRKRSQKNEDKEPKNKEVEVRRSKRQKVTKEKKQECMIKTILKKTDPEESAVYNLSSGSNMDSPRNLKRPAVDDSVVPSSKRTRSALSSSSSALSVPSRNVKTEHVLFTAFPYEEVKAKLETLGAVVVTDIMRCTVVLTQQIKRTFKLLCAVGLGRPIVGPAWVQACSDNNTIVDPWSYIMKDTEAEKRFQFSLERTLRGKRIFLKGYNVSSTPGVTPTAAEMKLIVECSGGKWKEGGAHWICVSCVADKALWSSLRRRGATIVTTEFILKGVLTQKLDIQGNQFM